MKNMFEKPTLQVITFTASDIITESLCLLDITVPNADQGDSGVDYGEPEY